MTRRNAAAVRRTGPAAKLKSERIQGAAERAPAVRPGQGGPGPGTAVPAAITKLLAQMPGWSFDPERSSFHARLLMGPSVEMPVDGGLTVAMADEKRVEIRLREGARPWTKAGLEGVRNLHRGLAQLGALLAAAQEAPALARRAR